MAIGMSPQEYWEGDPYLARFYYRAHKLKVEMRNQELWLQGWYNYNAVSSALANAFSKKTYKYIEKPIDLFKTEEVKNEEAVQKERDKAIEAFKAMRAKWESEHNGNTGT